MSRPTEVHYSAEKRILRYLKGTTKFGILYKEEGHLELIGFTNNDYAGMVKERRSTSCYIFMLSGAAVAWSSRKQPIVTLNTRKVEFVAATGSSCQAIWMQRVLKKIGYKGGESTIIYSIVIIAQPLSCRGIL